MENCEAMTSSPHSFAYSYWLVKKCFLKICETSKCHNFLIFQPIFIRLSLLCLKFFTLSSEIKLNLLWSSSLILPPPPPPSEKWIDAPDQCRFPSSLSVVVLKFVHLSFCVMLHINYGQQALYEYTQCQNQHGEQRLKGPYSVTCNVFSASTFKPHKQWSLSCILHISVIYCTRSPRSQRGQAVWRSAQGAAMSCLTCYHSNRAPRGRPPRHSSHLKTRRLQMRYMYVPHHLISPFILKM